MRRPALLSLSLYALGISLARILNIPVFYLSILLISLLVGLLVLYLTSRERLLACLLIAALVLTGSLSYHLSTRWFPSHHITSYLNRDILLQGRVLNEPTKGSEYGTFLCQCERILLRGKGVRGSGKVLVRWRMPGEAVGYGDVVRMRGKLNEPRGFSNPRGFDHQDYLARRGIYGVFWVEDGDLKVIAKSSGNPLLSQVIFPIKGYVRRNIENTLGGDPGGLLKGLLLGERKALSQQVEDIFANTGVIHVLAVSGLHVGIVVSILFLLLRLFRLPLRLALVCVSALLPLYAFMTGLRPSVIRATVMAVSLLIGWMLERETDPLNILGFAGLLILLFNPQSLFDVGFQLSFAATASILYLYPKLHPLLFGWLGKRRHFWSRYVASPFTVSVSAQLGVIPLLAYYFFTIPVVPVLANLIIVPLVGAAISLGFASSLAGLASQGLAGLFSASNWLVLSSTLKVVAFLDSLPFASFRMGRPPLVSVFLYYLLLIGLANWKSSVRARKLVIFSLLIGLNAFVWTGAVGHRNLAATFLDVGRGESCVLRFPNRKTLLIDGGSRRRGFDAGKDVVAPFLWSHGIKRIDLLVLSNPYNDHLGGLAYILENFEVGLIVEAGLPHPSRGYQRFLGLIDGRSIPYRAVRRGDLIDDLGIPIHVLHPPQGALEAGSDLRERSLVLELTYGEIDFIFPGDYGGPAPYGEVDVLKAPYYARPSLNLQAYIESLSPRIAICSARRSRPASREVLREYQGGETKVYWTDIDGAIVLTTDGRDISVRTMKADRRQLATDAEGATPLKGSTY